MKNTLRKLHVNISLKSLLVLIAGVFVLNGASAQTYVSSDILTNTVWTTSGSPYILTTNITIFSASLTIQPGVVVEFDNNAELFNDGYSLIANGTPTDSIIFTSSSATPFAGIYGGVEASPSDSFSYCRFSYASTALSLDAHKIAHCLFISNLKGVNISSIGLALSYCTFKYDTIAIYEPGMPVSECNFQYNGIGIENPDAIFVSSSIFSHNNYGLFNNINVGGGNQIQSCTFDTNKIAILDTAGFPGDAISYNSFKYNNIGINSEGNTITNNDIYANSIGLETNNDPTVSCNTLCSNTTYNMVATMAANENVSGNYWCSSDSANIQATIYDHYQNPSLGYLYFTPFNYVACTPFCNLSTSASATTTTLCKGDSTTLSVSISDPNTVHTAVWIPGGYSGNSYKVAPLTTATYSVGVTDSSGCKDTAVITITVIPSPIVTIGSIPSKICSNASPITLSGTPVGGVFSGHGVSGNTFTPDIALGNDVITYSYTSGGCTSRKSDTTYVAAPQPPPSICYVTTDTSGTFNTVVWQKTGMDTISVDSIIIYRQNVLNIYVPIGEVSVHAFSEYNDHTARPLVEPYFYTLGVHDTCGSDTNMSAFNETVFLQSSVGMGPNVANLDWNFYQGNPVRYYRILRDDSGTGNWHAIDSVQSTINAYSDRSAPINAGLRYMINTDWNVVCTPSYIIRPHTMGHYTFNTGEAYSNMTYVFPTGIVNLLDNNSVNVFPNPVNNTVSVSFNQAFSGSVTITNVLGQEVYSNSNYTAEKGNTEQIDMSNLKSGVYILTLESGGSAIRKKLLKVQ